MTITHLRRILAAVALTVHCLLNLPHQLASGDDSLAQDSAGSQDSKEASEEATRGIEFFEKRIRPLLIQQCYECHSSNKDSAEGSLRLDSPTGWLEGGDNGPAILPGDVEASLLIQAVRYHDESLQMPPVKPLDADDVALLEQWVRLGAPAPDKILLRAEDEPSDPEAGKEHWAFRPLVQVELPTV